MQRQELPEGWDKGLAPYPADEKGVATRVSSGEVLNTIAEHVLVVGAADLRTLDQTRLVFGAGDFQPPAGAATTEAATCTSVSASTPWPPPATGCPPARSSRSIRVLIFSDYARGSIRLRALMELPVIYIFTHDSIGLGEDGPTHQPIEQLAARDARADDPPCDANEVVECWRFVMQLEHEPVLFALSRQNLPTLDDRGTGPPRMRSRAYVIADCEGDPEVLLMASGSEVPLCITAHEAWSRRASVRAW